LQPRLKKGLKEALRIQIISVAITLNIMIELIFLFGLVCTALVTTFILFITLPIWLPVLLILSPVFVVLYLILKYTKAGQPLKNIVYRWYCWFLYESERPRKYIWQKFYNFMCWAAPNTNWTSMNYGYALITDEGKTIELDEHDEYERFSFQLYHYVTITMGKLKNFENKNILEVGSGRGGGLSFLKRNYKPISAVGVDFSGQQVIFCNNTYKNIKDLTYLQGDAEHLELLESLQPESFDYVINVESSHCYAHIGNFFEGVCRLMKKDGYFFFTDFRGDYEVEAMEKAIETYFDIIKKEDITLNVLHSLKLDSERREAIIEKTAPRFLRKLFKNFSGVEGSRINEEMKERKTLYLAYLLKKRV